MQTVIALVLMFLVGLMAILFGYLFFSLKAELRSADKRYRAESVTALRRTEALEQQISELRRELGALPIPAEPEIGGGINLNKRTQALRMMRLGEEPEHIAAALRLPKREVELLVKIQSLLLVDPSHGPTS